MSLHIGRRRGPLLNAEISVTSLVDVAFTLLVIFIITAPILQGGIEVDLPQADALPITSADALIVTVERGGLIHVGDVPVRSLEELETVLPQVMQARNTTTVWLRGDRDALYGDVLPIMGAITAQGGVTLGLVAQPEIRGRR